MNEIKLLCEFYLQYHHGIDNKYLHARIGGKYKIINKHNPISGHKWTEHGDFIGYTIDGIRLPQKHYKNLDCVFRDIEFDWQCRYGKFTNLI